MERKVHPENTQSNNNNNGKLPQLNSPTIQRRNSLMNISVRKFAAQEFDEKAVVLCQFCGGKDCKQEDYRTNKKQPNAIEGLHSNWITQKILAMQRPSERLIKDFNLFTRFKQEKINTILNLQEPGQHPYCGDGNLAMIGFSYDPQGFFNQGIKFFNESWEDMTATTFEHMMRMMNIFHNSLTQDKGKISVHCHAGRGRTLLVINSWLIYNDRMGAKETIDLAVEKREGVLTRSSQRDFLFDFQEQLKIRWKSFGHIAHKNLTSFVENQKTSLLKFEQVQCKFKPYVHQNIIDEFRNRVKKEPEYGRQILMAFLDSHSDFFEQKWVPNNEDQLRDIKVQINNHQFFNKPQIVAKAKTRILTQLFYDFYDNLPFTVIGIHALESLPTVDENKKCLSAIIEPEFVHEVGVEAVSVMLDLVHFVKMLIKGNLDLQKQGPDTEIGQCLFLRLSLLLMSKRKYSPKILPSKHNFRQCKLLSYSPQKRSKYMSGDQLKLAKFLRALSQQIEEDLSAIDGIIAKIRKVDTNIHYFSKDHNSQEGFFNKEQAKEIYDKSRI